jgi:PAS domain S-box-containing protein
MSDDLHAVGEEGERFFKELADNAPVMIWRSGPDALCDWFNKPWLDFVGRTMEQELGNGWAEGVHPDDFDRCLEVYLSAFKSRQSFTMTYRLRRADGAYREVLDNGKPFHRAGVFAGYFGSCVDVTEQMTAERQVSALTERLLDIQEEERRRIALELHDSTSQHLVAVQLGLTALAKGRGTDQTLADMREQLTEAHREIRTLSYLLHPPRLAAERLKATLQQFVDGFERRTGATIALTLEGGIDEMPYRVQRAVFRVIQEALANAHQHGRSKHICVQLWRREDGLRVEVADDGQSPTMQFVPGIGVPGMETRIERFGGALSVTPTPSGTSVSAFIPAGALEERADDDGHGNDGVSLEVASTTGSKPTSASARRKAPG